MTQGDANLSRRRLDDLCVVVLSHNRREELDSNVSELCDGMEEAGFEIIVVDNASTDGSRELLSKLTSKYQGLQVFYNDENLGVGEGRNTGRRKTNRAYVLHIDDDTRIGIPDIEKLCTIMDRRPDVGVVSPRIVHALTGDPQNDHGEAECEIGNYHGACHLVRGEALRRVGDIDPLCRFGGEELDYSIRMRVLDYRVLYSPAVVIAHNSLSRQGPEGKWRRRMRVYNFARLNFKHFPPLMAGVFSFRYLVSHTLSGVRQYGLTFAFMLPWQCLIGAKDGRAHYKAVPGDVVDYYSNPAVRPDFGNVPIIRKLADRFGCYGKGQ